MFGFFRRNAKKGSVPARPAVLLPRRAEFTFGLESLEDRRLLSVAVNAACDPTTTTTTTGTTTTTAALTTTSVPASSLRFIAASSTTTTTTTTSTGTQSITLADAPTAVQSGLKALAQGVTIPTTQVVKEITRRDGTTIYTAAVSVNGKRSRITVDSDGNPLDGKIAFSDAPTVVQTGLQAQTTVTISDSQIVSIRERGDTTVYSTAVNTGGRAKTLAVDADGTAVTRTGRTLTGGTTETFGDATAAIQSGLQALAQGTTIGSDQIIDELTLPDGTTVYSTLISIDGEATRIAVGSDGTALEGSIQFGDAPAAVKTGLQTLDTAGTIPATQLVRISTRPGSTSSSVYSTSVELNNTATVIAVNASGTAVTVFGDGGGDGFGHGFGGGGDFGGGGGGDGVTARTTVAYSTLPSAAQIGLQKLATGSTLVDTQQIDQSTLSDGTVVYSTTVTISGRLVRIAVDANGNFRQGEIAFADAPSAVQTALQNLATGTTLSNDQTVRIDTLRSGTTVYSTAVTLSNVAKVIAVDSSGATVSDGSTTGVLGGGGGGGRHGRGGFGGGFGGGGFGGGFSGGGFGGLGGTTGTTTTTTTGGTDTSVPATWRA